MDPRIPSIHALTEPPKSAKFTPHALGSEMESPPKEPIRLIVPFHAARKAHTLFDLCHNKTKKTCIEKVTQSIGR